MSSTFSRYRPLVDANPYRLPPAPALAKPAEQGPSPVAAPEPRWSITGIVETAQGVEVWLRNEMTKKTRVLRAGDSLHGVTLIEVKGDEAIFSVGETHGASFTVTVRLTTLFLPGREPEDSVDEHQYDGSTFSRYRPLVDANPYRLPPAPALAKPAEQGPSPVAAPEPRWSITGIVETAQGVEVWLRNEMTKKTRVLRAGDSLHGVTLIEVKGDEAIFSVGERQFVLQVGQFLGDKEPASR